MDRESEIYPCIKCEQDCQTDSALCSSCNIWIHSSCVPMSANLLSKWSSDKRTFLCYGCCHDNDMFNARDALLRLSANPSIETAQDIQLLLQTYNVKVPQGQIFMDMERSVDLVTEEIIQKYQPILLEDNMPAKTIGDGNCLYRAISLGLTRTEHYHLVIRLLTAIEIILNKHHYNTGSRKFSDPINDVRVVTSSYDSLVETACSIGAYSELLHMYAASAALKIALRSYYPSTINTQYHTEPYNRKVVGRSVRQSAVPAVTLMWTQTVLPKSSHDFRPNHFVPLIPRKEKAPTFISLDCDSFVCTSYDTRDDAIDAVDTTHNKLENTDSRVSDKDTLETLQDTDSEDVVETHNTVNDTDCDAMDMDQLCDNDNICDTSVCGDDSFGANDNTHELASGCLKNSFLEISQLIEALQNQTLDQSHSAIPPGVKNNVYFVLHNTKNTELRNNQSKSSFSDDCGPWNTKSGSTPKTHYIKCQSGDLKNVFLKNGSYCLQKKVKGKRSYTPLDPQPDPTDVLELCRYYTSLKSDSSYKKRVSWLAKGGAESVAIVEYLGVFPGLFPHGNSKYKRDYVRTPATVMQEMSELLKQHKPMDVYNKLTTKYDELTGPTGRKQVYDKKQNDRKKDRQTETGQTIRRRNIADHISEIDRLVANGNSVVKSIVRDQGKAPCLILYTDEQLTDIKTFCCSGQSILCIDKTFNLSDMHVTATCYKQVSVVKENTGEPPIFLGPLYIHDNSDFESYCNFFNHLRTKLTNADTSNLVLGSDEEQALVNAITFAFPESTHILCTRHLYQNTKQKLTDDCIDKKDRQKILDMIFDQDGLIEADDTICFDVKCDEIEEISRELSGKFLKYFQDRLKHNLKEKVQKPLASGIIERQWTNNNSESLNHVLKQSIDWKSKPLLDLIDILTTLIETQFKDLRKALVGTGQYRLADTHKHFSVSRNVWVSKTTDERDRLYRRFRQYLSKDKKTVTSTDGKMTVVKPRSLGKKIGQRKRKISERTVTFKKMNIS